MQDDDDIQLQSYQDDLNTDDNALDPINNIEDGDEDPEKFPGNPS